MSTPELIKALESAGSDVAGALRRFGGNEALYGRILRKFPEDESFAGVGPAIRTGNAGKAFACVHTLKGVAGNLGLTRLYQASCRVTESLRENNLAAAAAGYEELEAAYREVCAILTGGDGA